MPCWCSALVVAWIYSRAWTHIVVIADAQKSRVRPTNLCGNDSVACRCRAPGAESFNARARAREMSQVHPSDSNLYVCRSKGS
jgi:hypothetical protein